MAALTDFEKACFVIMPFGKKKVGKKNVDFDNIYSDIFEPAIKKANLPEGGQLEPKRTDVDQFASSISQDMFEYIMYSRIAFTDISGFNPNVFYELGIRHGTQESGTVIFRQSGIAIPFDIKSIKVFDYEFDTKKKIANSRALITRVLTNSLQRNRLDSPVRQALKAQRHAMPGQEAPTPDQDRQAEESRFAGDQKQLAIDALMQEAEEALRTDDLTTASVIYKTILRLDPDNVISRMRYGLISKKRAKHFDALEQFSYLTQLAPAYAEAWREKGVVESLIYRLVPPKKIPVWLPSGEESLKQATNLNPQDFDAWATWGGVLRRQKDFSGAYEKYQHSAGVSDGHPYPLLNAIKLEAQATGKIKLAGRKKQLRKAEQLRKDQSLSEPPIDVPWCFYDLAEMRLFQEDEDGFLSYLDQALRYSEEDWQIETVHRGLKDAFIDTKIDLPGLKKGMKKLEQAMARIKNKSK